MIININMHRRAVIITIILVILTVIGCKVIEQQQEVPISPKLTEVYGEYLPWSEVNHLFPKFSTATVTDCETKLKFKVQRRGGSLHTDVQPMTADDSTIMKKIYQNHWSWKRRAVLVEVNDGRIIAGSMNGMPHGQGAIKGNNFNGHFCIHFRDSKIHGSRKVDLAHQMMIWKAAGVFSQQVKQMNQEDAIEVFFTAMDQGDKKLAARMVASQKCADLIFDSLKNIESVKVESIEIFDKTDNTYKVALIIVEKGSSKQVRSQMFITARGTGEGSLANFN